MLEWTLDSPVGAVLARVRLKGEITEAVHFDGRHIDADEVVLVGDGVRYINSTGVKRLLEYLEQQARRGHVVAERWSPALVAQLNLMPRLASCVSIRSVIAPLECRECVAMVDILVDVDGAQRVPALPARRCEVCGGEMELAELEGRYFAFLTASD